ncbi:MAG: hypothetical protein D6712_14530 [Chloroflexi bacterium]|nr:MAG: hypothetical protein D6712_14530 [Chloroflexota bacterium]
MLKYRGWLVFITMLLLAACSAEQTPTPDPLNVPQIKQLATVYISPTPNAEQMQATRFAMQPTPTTAPPTPIPSPTPYIGVFIGEVAPPDFSAFLTPDAALALQATANAIQCDVAIGEPYLLTWAGNLDISRRLGCPIQEAFGFVGRVQIFERGVMYQREETGEIWAITSGAGVGRYWYVETAPPIATTDISAPEGLRVPTGDFGGMWRGVEGIEEALGFAITPPQRIDLGLQRFEGGSFFFDQTSGQIFALTVDGDVYGPY